MTNNAISTTKRSLVNMLLIAIVLALGLLTLVILPAEYDIDLTGFGKVSGLSKLSSDKNLSNNIPIEKAQSNDSDTDDSAIDDAPFPQGVANKHSTAPTTKTFTIVLKPLDEVEYKAVLVSGEPLFYRWSVVSNEDVYVDFHGDPSEGVFPEEYFQSYEEGEMPSSAGSFTATFTGKHGWYWLNIGEQDITINLEATGYYQSIGEIYRANQRDKYK